MAKKKDYVPRGNEAFHSWQLTLITYINTNMGGWNITGAGAEFTALQNKQAIYEPRYQQFIKTGQRSQKDIEDYDTDKKAYERMIRRFVAKYLVQNELVTPGDRTAMKIPIYDTTPTARAIIETSPSVRARSGEGSVANIECRVAADESRPSLHEESDGVEVKFIMVEPGQAVPPDLEPEDCTLYKLSKRARFKIKRTVADAGKKLAGFCRWVNLSEEEKSGPYSPVFVVTITE